MNLLEFRQFFRKTSGRYDLVNSDGSDNGANFYIVAAQRYLDRLADIPGGIGRIFRDLKTGKFLVTFEKCRYIQEVWCTGIDSSNELVKTKLVKKDLGELKEGNLVPTKSGMPLYYAPSKLRLITDSEGLTGGLGAEMDVLAQGHQYFNGINLYPYADKDYTIEVLGNFYSLPLEVDTDTTYWSVQHPEILFKATMMEIEIFHRNSEGVKDWKSAILDDVVGIDMDGVAEECADITQMEG